MNVVDGHSANVSRVSSTAFLLTAQRTRQSAVHEPHMCSYPGAEVALGSRPPTRGIQHVEESTAFGQGAFMASRPVLGGLGAAGEFGSGADIFGGLGPPVLGPTR